jgi:hypothetical protein
MKVKTFKHPSILLASCWYLIHTSGMFFGYFIGILIYDYCKTFKKIIFAGILNFTVARKSNTPCCLHQDATIY